MHSARLPVWVYREQLQIRRLTISHQPRSRDQRYRRHIRQVFPGKGVQRCLELCSNKDIGNRLYIVVVSAKVACFLQKKPRPLRFPALPPGVGKRQITISLSGAMATRSSQHATEGEHSHDQVLTSYGHLVLVPQVFWAAASASSIQLETSSPQVPSLSPMYVWPGPPTLGIGSRYVHFFHPDQHPTFHSSEPSPMTLSNPQHVHFPQRVRYHTDR